MRRVAVPSARNPCHPGPIPPSATSSACLPTGCHAAPPSTTQHRLTVISPAPLLPPLRRRPPNSPGAAPGFLHPEEAVAARESRQAEAAAAAAAGGPSGPHGLAKRVIACLDVRSNDQGDLVVTKVGAD